MTKDEFFYSFKQQTNDIKERIFLESGRGGHYSIAAWSPFAKAVSVETWFKIDWQNGETEIRQRGSVSAA